MRYAPTVEVRWSAEDEYVRTIMKFIDAAGLAITEAKNTQKAKAYRTAWAVVDTLRTLCVGYAPAVANFSDAEDDLAKSTRAYNKGNIRDAITYLNNAFLSILRGMNAVGLYGRTREKPKKLKEEANEVLAKILGEDLERVAEKSPDKDIEREIIPREVQF